MKAVFYNKKQDTSHTHPDIPGHNVSFCQHALENTEKSIVHFLRSLMPFSYNYLRPVKLERSRTTVISIILLYISVVRTLLCPRSFCTVVIFAPLYNNNVAFVCLAVWNETFLSILAILQSLRIYLFTFELEEAGISNKVHGLFLYRS